MAYKKRIPKPKPNPTQDQTPADDSKTIAEKHNEFRKSMEQNTNQNTSKPIDNQVELEGGGKIDISSEPFARPTVERNYTDAGINSHKTAATANDKTITDANAGTKKPATGNTTASDSAPANDFEPTPPEGDFEPTPPEGDDGYAETHTVNDGGDGTSPFNIPSGSANDLIDFGQKGLNYAIGIFGPMLVGVKLHKEFYNYNGVVEQIKEQNEKNTERIKFDNEDIDMIREPLVAMMQEKGIRGLTNGEKLVVGLLMIGVKKAKIVVEIKKENKILENNLMDLIRSQGPKKAPAKKTEPETVKQDEDNVELVEAEEA